MTEPNNKIIEILPEATFQIGLYLRSKMIIEPAFAILVSEGAFLAAARMKPDFDGGKQNTTLFGRPKEDINEDELNRIEAAANDFQSRINGVASNLTDPSMSWLEDVGEYRKLLRVQEHAREGTSIKLALENLIMQLNHYVRGRIYAVSMKPISASHNIRANSNRGFEHYLEPYIGSFEDMYDIMSPNERYLTWFYWDLLRDTQWGLHSGVNMSFESESSTLSRRINAQIAESKGIKRVEIYDLITAQEILNDTILAEVLAGRYCGGCVPKECYIKPEPKDPFLDSFWDMKDLDFINMPLPLTTRNLAVRLKVPESAAKSSSYAEKPSTEVRVPNELDTLHFRDLPFFSLREFLANVQTELSNICRAMIEDNYFGIRSFVDTLVCMSSEELKYLPLWAGGNEDGTGGVFEKPIPPAEYGVAPNGPGPAYHTGLSVFSQTSSVVDVDDDDQMTEVGTVNTSVAVENGYSSHVDRRVIMSDFGSIASFVHVQDIEGKEETKEVDHDVVHDLDDFNMSEDSFDDGHDDIDKGKGKSKDMAFVEEEDFLMVSDDEDDLDDFTL
jgi:hypothetical protein